MAVDEKYGQVTVEKQPGNPLGEDEPIFILRARDMYAAEAIRAYAEICQEAEPPTQPRHLAAIENARARFEKWQEQNPELVKQPD